MAYGLRFDRRSARKFVPGDSFFSFVFSNLRGKIFTLGLLFSPLDTSISGSDVNRVRNYAFLEIIGSFSDVVKLCFDKMQFTEAEN